MFAQTHCKSTASGIEVDNFSDDNYTTCRDIQEPAADRSGAQHYGDKHFLPVHDCSVRLVSICKDTILLCKDTIASRHVKNFYSLLDTICQYVYLGMYVLS